MVDLGSLIILYYSTVQLFTRSRQNHKANNRIIVITFNSFSTFLQYVTTRFLRLNTRSKKEVSDHLQVSLRLNSNPILLIILITLLINMSY